MAVSHLSAELQKLSLEAKKGLSLKDFDINRTVGTGTFGRVLLARHKGVDTYIVLKALRKTEILRQKQLEHVISEKTILAKLAHPFIPCMLACFQDNINVYLVLEYIIGGELFTYLSNYEKFPLDWSQFYAAEITLVLEYLHGLDTVYRDLKPENILLDREGHVKVTDFGFAKVLEDRTYTVCGTMDYLAPEIIKKSGHGFGVDFWALGVLIYEMIAGYPPFYDDNQLKACQKIMDVDLSFPSDTTWHPDAKSIIEGLLDADLTQRIGCLRRGFRDIKEHAFFKSINWDDLYNRKVKAPIVPVVDETDLAANFDDFDEEDITAGDEPPDQSLFAVFSS